MPDVRAIDCWVNVSVGSSRERAPDYAARTAEGYFKRSKDFFKTFSAEELIAIMDQVGVEKAIITLPAENPSEKILAFPQAYSDRFFLSALVDPRKGMSALWALEELVKSHPVVMARIVPFFFDLPPNDPIYYPLYAKCIELDLPISVNTGLPGPPKPGECQNPLYLDRVCYFFPELKISMAHGADPRWSIAIRLMIKYKNLHLMTSAYAPKYFPPELIQFMNTRGQDKIIFASDHPVLPMERGISEAKELDLREGVLDKFLYQNAERLFFAPRKPRY
ncbi:MAG TPA: amidohydrolase family protein [Candidatus Binatia bacterium]|jgi:predicted TIM-barrel fold metal-dependent hydrolase|nr:amidohydrolase family protein [Candidatus Binatia bacterium]